MKESNNAFESAIKQGTLSDVQSQSNYAGNYMYMGIHPHTADWMFKHIDTREYISVTDSNANICTFN